MTDEASPGIGKVEDLFKTLVWDTMIQSILSAFFSDAPFLALPPFKQIISGVVKLFTDRLYGGVRMTVDLEAIALVNAQHQKEFEAASVALRSIAMHQGVGSEAFKTARENARQALARFVSFSDAA